MISNLPSVVKAKLPIAYEAAREALAKCEHVDECKTWADKAAALASYAKQSKDETMQRAAERIRARAIRRAGELLEQIQPSKGGKPTHKGSPTKAATGPSRIGVGHAAGLSTRQTKEALRVARVPASEFESAIEAERPATVTELAERGTRSKPKPLVDLQGRDPNDFRLATEAQGGLRALAKVAELISPAVAVRGSLDHEISELVSNTRLVLKWSQAILAIAEKET
jgi:hypothetical protein